MSLCIPEFGMRKYKVSNLGIKDNVNSRVKVQ